MTSQTDIDAMTETPERQEAPDLEVWLRFAEDGNIRKWDREPFPEGEQYINGAIFRHAVRERDAAQAEVARLTGALAEAETRGAAMEGALRNALAVGLPGVVADAARAALSDAERPPAKAWRPTGEVWEIFRAATFKRDGEKCRYCGDESGPFDIDHVVPLAQGGETIIGNLVVACRSCNLSKGSKLVEEWKGRGDG